MVERFVTTRLKEKDSRSHGDRFSDFYTVFLLALVGGGSIVAFFFNLPQLTDGAGLLPSDVSKRISEVSFSDFRWPALALSLFLSLIWWWVMKRMGPLSIPMEKLVWIYQHPVDRLPFLRRRVSVLLTLSAVYGALGGLIPAVPLVLGEGWSWFCLVPIFIGLVLCPIICLYTVNRQVRRSQSRPLYIAKGQYFARTVFGDPSWLRRFDWPALSGAAAKNIILATSIRALDTAGLGRIMFPGRLPFKNKKSSKKGIIPSITRGRPVLVLVSVEWITFIRSRHVLLAPFLCLVLTMVLVFSPLIHAPILILIVLWSITILVSEIAGTGIKHGEGNPQRYGMWPISDRAVRWAQMAVPTFVMTVWSLLVFGALGTFLGHPIALLQALLAGVGAGAVSTLISDRQPSGGETESFLATPMGPLPVKSIWTFVQGYIFLAVLYLVPSLTVLGALPSTGPTLFVLGVMIAVVAIAVRRNR